MITRTVSGTLLLVLWAGAVGAQAPKRPEVVGIRVGLDNCYKAGLWTPVTVTLRGGSKQTTGRVYLTVPDGDGIPSRVTTAADRALLLLPLQESAVMLYVRFGRLSSRLRVDYVVDGRVAAYREFETALTADETHFQDGIEAKPLIVTVGSSSLGVEEAVRLCEEQAEWRAVVARVTDVEELPTRWYGYEGVDAVVLSTSQAEMYRRLASHSARVEALDEWVRLGGKLVFCVGFQGDQILDEGEPLARFAPGRYREMTLLRGTQRLEEYAGSSTPISKRPDGLPWEFSIPLLVDVQGKVEQSDADSPNQGIPLVIRSARGFGQVVFVAADLDRAPLRDWDDRSALMARLLGLRKTRSESEDQFAQSWHYGYNDLAGQLRSALDQFTGVRLVPFWVVALLVLGYVVLIGPADYFFLRKVVRRMELTWITFPAIVLVVSLAAYFLAYYLKGDQLRVNQVDLVDVDTVSGSVRGTTWANLFSPRMESFHLGARPRLPDGTPAKDPRVLVAWLGLPGDGLGGMNPRAAGPALWSQQYDFSPELSEMQGVPVQVWSTKSLTARWSARTAEFPAADLVERDRALAGSVTNTFDFPLTDCVMVYGRSAYRLGTLGPQAKVELEPGERTDLRTLWTGGLSVADVPGLPKAVAAPYDPSALDPTAIVQAMMFYQAAGGRRNAHLLHDYQGFVDFSSLLETGRAVLVARAPRRPAEQRPGAHLVRLGGGQPERLGGSSQDKHPQDQRFTVLRFVFPVQTE